MGLGTFSRLSKQAGRRYTQGGAIMLYAPLASQGSVVYSVPTPNAGEIEHGLSFNAPADFLHAWKLFTATPVPGVNRALTAMSLSTGVIGIRLQPARYFGLWIRANSVSGATINVVVSFLESMRDVANAYAVPVSGGLSLSLTTVNPQVVALTPTPAPYIQFQLQGTGSNGADVTVDADFWTMR